MMMKATAAARLIQASGTYSPSKPPTKTPTADTQARAIDAPMRTAHGRRVCAARVIVASWVLSPNSAKKITPNVVNITHQSICFLPHDGSLKLCSWRARRPTGRPHDSKSHNIGNRVNAPIVALTDGVD